MDLDRDSLELMLNLLDTDTDATSNVSPADRLFVTQNKKRIRELCHDMQKKGHAKHLNLDNINVSVYKSLFFYSVPTRNLKTHCSWLELNIQ